MPLVWRSYTSDLGRVYPMLALSTRQINDVSSDINSVELLPIQIQAFLLDVTPCAVDGLTPRFLILWSTDGAQFQLNYPQPFSQNLVDFLTFNLNVTAFEFVGEKLKYGRLRRMLNNV